MQRKRSLSIWMPHNRHMEVTMTQRDRICSWRLEMDLALFVLLLSSPLLVQTLAFVQSNVICIRQQQQQKQQKQKKQQNQYAPKQSIIINQHNKINEIHRLEVLLSSSSSLLLSSSSNESGGSADDELSKLIGKRAQIKKNVKKRIEAIEENLQSAMEPVVDLDLDKLPSFKTQRPVRSSRKSENDKEIEDDGDDGDSSDGLQSKKKGNKKKKQSETSSAASPIIDYMADYEDENDFHIPNRIGISTMDWGDTSAGSNFVVGKNVKLTKRQIKAGMFVAGDVQLAYQAILAAGITIIETSPLYGITSRPQRMSAEQLLGQCIRQHPSDLPECRIVTSSGVSAWTCNISLQHKFSLSKSLIGILEQSLHRLSGNDANSSAGSTDVSDTLSAIDLFAVSKSSYYPTSFLAAGLAAQIESGQANYVGVQDITSPRRLRKLCRILKDKYDTVLTSNMFEFSLTNTRNEQLINICKDNGIIPLIRNPLDNGLASGIYTASNPSGGSSGSRKFSFQQLEKLQPLHSVQETVAERVKGRVSRNLGKTQERFKSKYGPPPQINTDITTSQIALQYVIAKGGVPLPTVNTPTEAQTVVGCLGWSLTDDEVSMLDSAIALCKL